MSVTLTSWRPVLVGSERERALRAAVTIADRLRWLAGDGLGCSLAYGAAGLAVTFWTLAKTLDADRYGGPAQRYLELACDGACAEPGAVGLGLHGGLTGVAWAELVCGDAAVEDLDELLAGVLEAGPWPGRWDLSSGLLGVGVYALRRARSDPRLLALVTRRLAEGDPRTMPDLPALVALSALAVRLGCEQARGVLANAAGTLLADPGDPPGLDVATALALAAPLTLHPAVGRELQRAMTSANLRASTTNGLDLYGGAAGAGHMLQTLATMTGSEDVAGAARRCQLALLNAVEAGRAPVDPGLLAGGAGVVLALLAAATDDVPAWNQLLLLS
jgi:lantibiotic biosynthesis protein